MSNDWDVYCRTCDSDMGLSDLNHQKRQVQQLCQFATALGDLAPLYNVIDVTISNFPVNLAWFAAHRGHDIVARCEYGYCADECGEFISESSAVTCRLKPNHGGIHKPTVR